MGKASRSKRNLKVIKETHEPDNFSPNDVTIRLTGADKDECISVTIHGVTHNLHSGRVLGMMREFNRVLAEWERRAIELAASGELDDSLSDLTWQTIAEFRARRGKMLVEMLDD